MGDAGGVLRDGAQRHQKHVFGVVRRQMDVLRAGLFVPVFFHTQFQRVDGLAAQVFKSGVAMRSHGVSLLVVERLVIGLSVARFWLWVFGRAGARAVWRSRLLQKLSVESWRLMGVV